MTRAAYFLGLLLCISTTALAGAFPAALERAGYPAAEWRVILAWEENTRTGTLLQGYHLESLETGETRDVYLDRDEHLVADTELTALDIPPKQWDAPPMTVSPEIAPGFPNAKAASALAPWLAPPDNRVPETVFSAPDAEAEAKYALDDSEAKGLTRYGSVMDLPTPLYVAGDVPAFGEWYSLSDGRRVWSATVRVLGAVGLRLHFSAMNLPTGAVLIAYSPEAPQAAQAVAASLSGWGPSCYNEAVTLECRLPAGVSSQTLALSVDRIGWMFKLPFEKSATIGACNIGIACRADWLTVAMAVGRLAKANSDGLWACTGALVTDTVTDSQIPYLLTANHCVSGQSEAETLEVYWLYQSDTCDAAPPAMNTVPRTTGGADYLAGAKNADGTDFAFLRLNNNPPDGLTFAGYSTDPGAVDTEVTAIHHPQGQPKQISFGTVTDTGSPRTNTRLKPIERFHEVHWQEGTTEQGSSGCPLFVRATPLIIGQLYGGYASCTAKTEPDYFGRFDVTYPVIQKWLSPAASTEGENGGTDDGCQWFKTTDAANAGTIAALVGMLMLAGMLGRGPRP